MTTKRKGVKWLEVIRPEAGLVPWWVGEGIEEADLREARGGFVTTRVTGAQGDGRGVGASGDW
jgi:hypothetical protein